MWRKLRRGLEEALAHTIVTVAILAGIKVISIAETRLFPDKKLAGILPISWVLDGIHGMTLVVFGALGAWGLYKIWIDTND